jgi:hypothetical protein
VRALILFWPFSVRFKAFSFVMRGEFLQRVENWSLGFKLCRGYHSSDERDPHGDIRTSLAPEHHRGPGALRLLRFLHALAMYHSGRIMAREPEVIIAELLRELRPAMQEGRNIGAERTSRARSLDVKFHQNVGS